MGQRREHLKCSPQIPNVPQETAAEFPGTHSHPHAAIVPQTGRCDDPDFLHTRRLVVMPSTSQPQSTSNRPTQGTNRPAEGKKEAAIKEHKPPLEADQNH